MQGDQGVLHGRGATRNPPNHFTPLWHVRDPDWTAPMMASSHMKKTALRF